MPLRQPEKLMRTTLDIADDILAEVKEMAQRQRVSPDVSFRVCCAKPRRVRASHSEAPRRNDLSPAFNFFRPRVSSSAMHTLIGCVMQKVSEDVSLLGAGLIDWRLPAGSGGATPRAVRDL